MLGANRLGIEALPLFTFIPIKSALQTNGFSGNKSDSTRWTWPIWEQPVTLAMLPSLFSLSILQVQALDNTAVDSLGARGIVTAFRCQRILVGKTPNFTPAQRIA